MNHKKTQILVTGAKGFIGKNLIVALRRRIDVDIIEYDLGSPKGLLTEGLAKADVIYHLAGVNRPERVEEFASGNFDFTQQLCDALQQRNRKPKLVLSSSTQAVLDNPYGVSKRQAEEAVVGFGKTSGAQFYVFRLPGVFGKWCRPDYNSVVATFCHNIAHDLPISISNPATEIDLVYVDDVVKAFISILDDSPEPSSPEFCSVEPVNRISLGNLAAMIRSFKGVRETQVMPDIEDLFIRALHSTYISYLPVNALAYPLTQRTDQRGELAELLKSPSIGQVFVSRTRPGFTRGNHYHDSKVEKFVVMDGDAVIRFRHILGGQIIEYPVSGREFRVVDIPPGYTHSIRNIGKTDLIVLFWAAEIFDPDKPDAYYEEV